MEDEKPQDTPATTRKRHHGKALTGRHFSLNGKLNGKLHGKLNRKLNHKPARKPSQTPDDGEVRDSV